MGVEELPERLTYAQWRQLSPVSCRFEVHEGAVWLPPPRFLDQQWVVQNLSDLLSPVVRYQGIGRVFAAAPSILIRREPLCVRQASLVFYSRERLPAITREELAALPDDEIAPDLVVEVLHPRHPMPDRGTRLSDYRVAGVREVWWVHTYSSTLEVLLLTPCSSFCTASLRGRDRLRSNVLPTLDFRVERAFE